MKGEIRLWYTIIAIRNSLNMFFFFFFFFKIKEQLNVRKIKDLRRINDIHGS